MKRAKFTLLTLLLLIVSVVNSKPTILAYNNNKAELIINQYIDSIKSNKWDAYVELFNYDEATKNDLLSYLKDSKNQAKKEGIHGIKDIKLVSVELTTDPEFISKGDYVYDVLLDMKVNKTSEFYMNGVTRHVFVFRMRGDGLKIETVYFRGLVGKGNEQTAS